MPSENDPKAGPRGDKIRHLSLHLVAAGLGNHNGHPQNKASLEAILGTVRNQTTSSNPYLF